MLSLVVGAFLNYNRSCWYLAC